MAKIVRLTESDLNKITKKIMNEFHLGDDDDEGNKGPGKREQQMVKAFKQSIVHKLGSGGSDWDTSVPNPKLRNLIDGIRRVCDDFESMM